MHSSSVAINVTIYYYRNMGVSGVVLFSAECVCLKPFIFRYNEYMHI